VESVDKIQEKRLPEVNGRFVKALVCVDSMTIDVTDAGVVSMTVDVPVDDDSAIIQLCLNNSYLLMAHTVYSNAITLRHARDTHRLFCNFSKLYKIHSEIYRYTGNVCFQNTNDALNKLCTSTMAITEICRLCSCRSGANSTDC